MGSWSRHGGDEADCETTEVVICGCGPTGAMLSVLLSQLGVENICLEKEEGIATDPRGIALDEDGIRALQSVGVLDQVYTKIGRCMGTFNFVGGVHSDLKRAPFMTMDYGTSEGGTGHVGFICHKQPALEAALRGRIAESEHSQLRSGCTLTSIDEDEDRIYATYEDTEGVGRRLAAKFVVGADGKTGFTRKKYLESKGVLMQHQSSGATYEETWVAMNLRLTLPTPKSHPDFALWALGYTPEQVYDLFFPQNFRFLCNPDRPAVCGHFGLPEDRMWRFEYVVKSQEDGNEMASPENVKRVVFPYLSHPGRMYGLPQDVAFPEDCIETLRARPFFFSARSCNMWALGRAILCGDSAHVFPPFGGQGIVSGFRDASSLAWRLKLACQTLPDAHEELLSAWYLERKQQLELSLAATVENGRYVTENNPIRIFVRDSYLAILQWVPQWKRWLEQGARREGMCRYKHQPGFHFLEDYDGGLLFPQIYCRSLVSTRSPIQFTDDVIFASRKHAFFQLVVVLQSASDLDATIREIRSLDINKLSQGFVECSETTIILHDLTERLTAPEVQTFAITGLDVVRIASAAEFSASPLCQNRPAPRYYDPCRVLKELPDKKFLVLRPDRFVFAACPNVEDLSHAVQLIEPVLKGSKTA